MWRGRLGIFILLLCWGCSGISDLPGAGLLRSGELLTVMHTNDHHGRFWKNVDGEYGLPARKSLVDRIRTEVTKDGGSVLLLDAGDINTGVPESSLLNARPDILGMNALGYDAMAVGNHEFDKSLDILRTQESWMQFPLLSANVYSAQGSHLFTQYAIFQRGSLRVAVIGLSTEETATIANPKNIAGLTFRSAIDEAQDLVPKLRQEVDVLIVLGHLGSAPHGGLPPSVALAREVPGIDLIVDGHSHTALFQPLRENGTLIVQAGEFGKYLGRVDLQVSKGRVNLAHAELLPVNLIERVDRGGETVKIFRGGELPQDAGMVALLQPFLVLADKELQKRIGSSKGRFLGDRRVVRSTQTDLGTLACRALMKGTGAQLAVMNGGGIRADLPAGDLRFKDVLEVKPFGNTVCTVRLRGSELVYYLETLLRIAPGAGGFPQFAGISVRFADGKLQEAAIGGEPLESGKTYVLAVERYLADGGDGYPKLSGHPEFKDCGVVDADLLAAYIGANSPLDPMDYAPHDEILRQ